MNVDDYRRMWREATEKHGRNRFRMGTEAWSGGKEEFNISRDEEDYFCIDRGYDTRPQDEDNYYGHWITGFGFYNVRFPKATSRELTDEEWEWLLDHPVTIG